MWKMFRCLLILVTIVLWSGSLATAQILDNGVPNIDDDRLYAWYDGNEANGADGIEGTPIWPNKQGDPARDIANGFTPAATAEDFSLTPVPTENGHMALEYWDVVTWANEDQWGAIELEMTVFVAATVRDVTNAYLFTGNQGGGGTEANANYQTVEPDTWSIKADLFRIETAPVVADELQYHSFVFSDDEMGRHYINGELAGEDEVGPASLRGFVLGGRQNGGQRATVDFAEVLIYDVALGADDRQAIESYLDTKFFDGGVLGDFNGDGELTVIDIDLLTERVIEGTNPPAFDLNGDNLVDQADRTVWVSELKPTWFGDADLNGEFDTLDFVAVFSIGRYETKEPAGWGEGDWSGDGVFDSGDFVTAFIDGGYEQGPKPGAGVVAVPEPSSWLLMILTVAPLWTLRRRSH